MAFSEYLRPDIIGHYKSVLPCLFLSLDDPTDEVRETSCCALEAFCENLGQEIVPYLEPLLTKLLDLLKNGKPDVRTLALSAISSTANAASTAFFPYYNTFAPLLKEMMTLTNETDLEQRSRHHSD